YAKARDNLDGMIEAGILRRDGAPGYYVYRLSTGDHVQTGIVGAGSVAAYEENRIRRHEFTRPDKEIDRFRQIEAMNAQTGPVFVTHPPDGVIAKVMASATRHAPAYSVQTHDGAEHALWPISDEAVISRVSNAFENMKAIYIADGHHRSAAAARVAAQRKEANPDHRGDEAYNFFLIVSFPADEVRILDYNRLVRDLGGMGRADFLDAVADAFDVTPVKAAVRPGRAQSFGMYLGGAWYRLVLKDPPSEDAPPVKRLDVSLLNERLLEPILGVGDQRLDQRMGFVGGSRGLHELEARVNSGDWAVALSLFPTRVEDLKAVADAGQVMPPKSTWFEPKLADGLVSLMLD
ncbi:MAG: DUF1015 family protein, partial [Rhodospirillales bacterium]|nr:DUF1015 family protein [Rhodospirillales bacterium]